jgi:hypothetical protein
MKAGKRSAPHINPYSVYCLMLIKGEFDAGSVFKYQLATQVTRARNRYRGKCKQDKSYFNPSVVLFYPIQPRHEVARQPW